MRIQRMVDEMNLRLRKLKEFYEKIREYELKDWLLRKLGSMRSRMKRGWNTYNLWFICIVAAITVFAILFFISPTTDQDNARYILSAISQGLAAILALVFTITLVVAQMTRRYTAMDKIIFRPETIILMIVFGTGIVIPLLVLKRGFWGQGVNLSIAFAVFCAFSLIPFLRGVNGVLKYEIGIWNLHEEILEAIESGNNARIFNKFTELKEIIKSATKEFREGVASDIVIILSGIGIKSAEKKLEALTLLIESELEFIGIEGIKNGFEMTPALCGLKDIRDKATENEWVSVIKIIDLGISDFKAKAMENNLDFTASCAMFVSKNVDMEATTEETDSKSTVNGLWYSGAFVTEYFPKQVDHAIHALKEKEKEVGKDLLMEWGRDCISGYPNLKPALEEFKRRYEMCEVEE